MYNDCERADFFIFALKTCTILLNILLINHRLSVKLCPSVCNTRDIPTNCCEIFVLLRRKHAILLTVLLVNSIF